MSSTQAQSKPASFYEVLADFYLDNSSVTDEWMDRVIGSSSRATQTSMSDDEDHVDEGNTFAELEKFFADPLIPHSERPNVILWWGVSCFILADFESLLISFQLDSEHPVVRLMA